MSESLIVLVSRRILAEVAADPFAPDALAKAHALKTYLSSGGPRVVLTPGELTMLDEWIELIEAAQCYKASISEVTYGVSSGTYQGPSS